jgi:hypothetical protein
MVRQIENLLKELGWADGFHIPVANEANKALEEQVRIILAHEVTESTISQ